jgi:hypothetical protein
VRQHKWYLWKRSRVGLVLLLLLLAVGPPTALAAKEKPKPQPLWQAFPLNPTGERLGSVSQQPRAHGRPEVASATKAKETPTQTSRPSAAVLALVAGAAVLGLALVGLTSVRHLSLRNHRTSATVTERHRNPWSSPAGNAPALRPSRPLHSAADLGAGPRGAALHPDVPASAYRLRRLERRPHRRPRVAPRARRVRLSEVFAEDFMGFTRRLRHVVWNDRTAPVIVGISMGVFAAFLLVYWIG